MRLLLDENVSPAIGEALTAAGHDIGYAVRDLLGASDRKVVEFAISEQRALVSEDKDFGDLAFVAGMTPPGLIRLALPKLG